MQHYKILSNYNSCDQIAGNTGREYGIYGGQWKCIQAFGAGDLRKETTCKTGCRREGSTELNL
jgi:hypothetical protein